MSFRSRKCFVSAESRIGIEQVLQLLSHVLQAENFFLIIAYIVYIRDVKTIKIIINVSIIDLLHEQSE